MSAHRKTPFTLLSLDHLGIVPKDLPTARRFFSEILGLSLSREETVATEGVKLSMLPVPHNPIGTNLELLAPLDTSSTLQSYLDKKGGGIHHLAFRVDNLAAAVAHLQAHGVRLINAEPRPGAHGSKVVFVHPHSTGGILVELVSKP